MHTVFARNQTYLYQVLSVVAQFLKKKDDSERRCLFICTVSGISLVSEHLCFPDLKDC